MESDSPDDTLLGDVFNPQAFLSSYTYLSIAAAKRLFGQLNMPNIWFNSQIFSDSITVGSTGGFSVSTLGHVTMRNGEIADEIPIETNDQSIPTTAFCHELRDDIFVGDHTWTGENVFQGETHTNTLPQNTAHDSTLIATIAFVWNTISTVLSQANTWSMLQTFSSGISAASATITGLFTGNAMEINTLTINTSATTPNVLQSHAHDESIANLSYVWDSLGAFLTQQHTWTQTQFFVDISSININTYNLSGNYIDGNSITANTATFALQCNVPTISQIATPSTSASSTQYVTDSIASFLSQSHTWPLDQHFAGITAQSVDCSGNVNCLDMVAGNSIRSNIAVFDQQCNVPTISQIATPSTSAASTRYVSDSIASFLAAEHTWPSDQHFAGISAHTLDVSAGSSSLGTAVCSSMACVGNVSANNCNITANISAASCNLTGALTCNTAALSALTATSIDCSYATISSLGSTQMNTKSLTILPPAAASSSPFDQLQNALTIGSIYDSADCLILTASRTQDNGTSMIQSCIDNHNAVSIIYTPLSLNPFGGKVAINKTADATIWPNTIALDVSGNVMVSGEMSANSCSITSNISATSCNLSGALSCNSAALISLTATGNIAGNTCTLSGDLTCDLLRSSAAANLTITPSSGHHTVISSGNLNVSAGNINMHGGLYCDDTVSGLVFTATTLIVDNITSPNDINLNGNFYAANTYGIQHRLLTVAYMINGSSPNTMYPLICSITDFVNDSDDSWIVAPGYHLYLYSGTSYTSFLGELDNTNGFQPLHASSTSIYGSINSVSSVKVYYHLTQITIGGIS